MVKRAKPEASIASTQLTTKNYSGPHLLSHVGGKRIRDNTGSKRSIKDETTSPRKRLYEPATDEDPLSSSDESEDSPCPLQDDDKSYLKKTLAGKLAENEAPDISQKNGKKRPKAPLQQATRRSARKRLPAEKQQWPTPAPNEPLDEEDDELFFLMSSQSSKRRRTINYGGLKNIHTHSSSFGIPTSSLSGSSPPGKSSQGFPELKRVLEDDSTAQNPQGGFRVPIEINVGSPLSKLRTRSKNRPGKDNNTSQSEFRMPCDPGQIATFTYQDTGFKEPPGLSLSSASLGSAKDHPPLELDDEPISPLSSVTSNMFWDLSQEDKAFLGADRASGPAAACKFLCPMCKEPVEPALLLAFQAQPNQRVRDQHRFCDSHKKRSAEKEWHEKGYPQIDWETFEERVRSHFPALEKILESKHSSFYRNILNTTMKSGKAKNFRLTISGEGLENVSCGYYGSKGASKMLHLVTTEFSRRLRRLASTDNLVNTAGVAGYSQAVLVPELTLLLVKEDMGVDDQGARQILRESMEIGEKLNFAPNDFIPVQNASN